jgi:hypothetical protein
LKKKVPSIQASYYKKILLHIHNISLPELPGSQGTWDCVHLSLVNTGLEGAKTDVKRGCGITIGGLL